MDIIAMDTPEIQTYKSITSLFLDKATVWISDGQHAHMFTNIQITPTIPTDGNFRETAVPSAS